MKRLFMFNAIAFSAIAMTLCFALPFVPEQKTEPTATAISPTPYAIERAKDIYRAAHPRCESCGDARTFLGKSINVHHVQPVHLFPAEAANTNNMISLCFWCHRHIGHQGNTHLYVTNLSVNIRALQPLIGRPSNVE